MSILHGVWVIRNSRTNGRMVTFNIKRVGPIMLDGETELEISFYSLHMVTPLSKPVEQK